MIKKFGHLTIRISSLLPLKIVLFFTLFSPHLLLGFDQNTIASLHLTVINVYKHDASAFTQGLVFYHNLLYESTGLYHQSSLRELDFINGKTIQTYALPSHFFGEGLAIVNHELIQLTWKEGQALVYQLNPIRLIRQIPYEGEGWGLCYDTEENKLYMSNGSSEILKRHPQTFAIEKTITVTWGKQPVHFLNDLICVGKHIYANVWNTDYIIRLDKETGIVDAMINAAHLLPKNIKQKLGSEAVLNGIAYHPLRQTFFLTGKLWPYLYEVKFELVP